MILENELLDVAVKTVSRETPLILSASHGQEEAALQLLAAIPRDGLVREEGKGGRESIAYGRVYYPWCRRCVHVTAEGGRQCTMLLNKV